MNFVKTALCVALSAAALFATAGAQATVIDSYSFGAEHKVKQGTPTSFEHDLTDHGFVAGATDYISGLLQVRLTDGAAGESGTLFIGAQSLDFSDILNGTYNKGPAFGSFFDIALDAASLADLNADGKIQVRVTSSQGDFYFANSTLTLQTAAVPEPMSLALMGAGLLGLGAARRRRNAR